MTVREFTETCKLITNKFYDIDLMVDDKYFCSITYHNEDEQLYFYGNLECFGECEIKKIEVYTDELYDGTFDIVYDLYIEVEE